MPQLTAVGDERPAEPPSGPVAPPSLSSPAAPSRAASLAHLEIWVGFDGRSGFTLATPDGRLATGEIAELVDLLITRELIPVRMASVVLTPPPEPTPEEEELRGPAEGGRPPPDRERISAPPERPPVPAPYSPPAIRAAAEAREAKTRPGEPGER